LKERIEKLITLTAMFLLFVGSVYAVEAIWTFYGGYILVVGTVEGKVLYSYDNSTWTSGNIIVNKSASGQDKLYVSFNVTSIVGEGTYNFTFYLSSKDMQEVIGTKTVQLTFEDIPKMIYCPEVLDTELTVGNTYQVIVVVKTS